MRHCRGAPAKRDNGSAKKLVVNNLVPEYVLEWNYFVLVELETIPETGLSVLINQVILFFLRHQRAQG